MFKCRRLLEGPAIWLTYVGILLHCVHTEADFYEGDGCVMRSIAGICTPVSKCTWLQSECEKYGISESEVASCGNSVWEEIICCPPNPLSRPQATITTEAPPLGIVQYQPSQQPMPLPQILIQPPLQQPTFRFPQMPSFQPVPQRTSEPTQLPLNGIPINSRPADLACEDIKKNLYMHVDRRIIGGSVVTDRSIYPHMAAIGYNSSDSTYQFLCGGSLIAPKFVLTAAHCVYGKDTPVMVRLGVTDFDKNDEMMERVDVMIARIRKHPGYKYGMLYNDIAILELAEEVKITMYVRPVCLYTDMYDPPSSLELYVTGWGVINQTTLERSNALREVQQKIVPLQECNTIYVASGLDKRISRGILPPQLCTIDPEEASKRDACQGDSGGPLHVIMDKDRAYSKLVGVISFGLGCATNMPAVYARVSSYLDFIESVVWPSDNST